MVLGSIYYVSTCSTVSTVLYMQYCISHIFKVCFLLSKSRISYRSVIFSGPNFCLWGKLLTTGGRQWLKSQNFTKSRSRGSRLLRQLSRVRIRYLSQWRTGRVTIYTAKSRGKEGNIHLRLKKEQKEGNHGRLSLLCFAIKKFSCWDFLWLFAFFVVRKGILGYFQMSGCDY